MSAFRADERSAFVLKKSWFLLVAFLLAGSPAFSELQQIEVGGAIEIYGNFFNNFYENGDDTRAPASSLVGRPIGDSALDDNGALLSIIRAFDGGDGASGYAWVEQRTSLHVKAQFTDNVSTVIEFDSIANWGDDSRSDFVTGLDFAGGGDVALYQAYIEANEFFGLPLRLRIGRQELILGNEWLVGNNYWYNPLTYLSFDGMRLTWAQENYAIDVFSMKLAERFQGLGSDDTDFYGIYASYTGLEDWEFNAYWLYLHDGLDIEDTTGDPVLEFVEGLWGLDDYASTDIHTVGLRAAGAVGNWELEAEAAYQWGDAAAAGSTFVVGTYGADDASYSAWAGQFTVGYTIEAAWEPYVYVGAEYYGGEDHRDRALLEYLNPFYTPRASLSFNRLFSTWEADWFLDGSALSNLWIGKAGISASPTDKIEIGLDLLYMEALEAFDTPVWGRFGSGRTPLTLLFPFLTRESDTDLGFQTILWSNYAYSDNLSFEAGWAHLFTGDGLEDGNFVDANGLEFLGGLGDEDADYLWMGAKLEF